jgi:photosystem II stability/assembly factor-like uncharacterized protein
MRRWLCIVSIFVALAAAPDSQWRIIGPGGGGSMFHPTVSPHDSRVAVVACDMTGNYITTDGGENWRFFSLRDPARFFVFDPIDPNVIYASTGVLYRSADRGFTWKVLLPRPAAIEKITTGDDHASENYHVREDPVADVSAFAVDPEDSRSLYAAVAASLWYSFDTGTTWRRIADLAGRMSAIWIDPHSLRGDRTIYAAGPNAIYIRRDGKWNSGESPGAFTSVAAALPVFYAIAGGRMWVSDGGMRWQSAGAADDKVRPAVVAVSAGHPDIAYGAFDGRTFGIAKTIDRGRHWESLAYNGRDAWLSDRFGAGWAGAPYGIGCAPGDPRVCYATDSGRVMRTTDGGRSWLPAYSRRGAGGNWTTNGIDVTTSYGVHFDPFDPRHRFITYTDIGLWASDNAGESWYSATTAGVPGDWVNTTYWVEFDPGVRGRMWAVMSGTHDLPRPKMWRRTPVESYRGGVVRSDDGGRTWRAQTNGMPQTAATHILRDPSGALYVTGFGRGVYKSTDAGEHWSQKNSGIEGERPFAWRLARDTRGALYLVVARRSEDGSYGNAGDGALYRSTDSAEHWSRVRLPEGINGPNGLAVDPRDADRVYLAAWGRSTHEGAVGGGIWMSINGGVNWRNVLDKDQHIYDVTVNPRDPRVLYAAGFEGNVWRSADRGVTWERVPGFDFKWGHRVIFDPYDAKQLYVTTFGGSVWSGPCW